VIEMMLEAERALGVGLLDQADRLYRQVVAADPRNAIAIVGLARVALERGDEQGAYSAATRALSVDPENPMAKHLAMRMSEILRARGESVPGPTEPDAGAGQRAGARPFGTAHPGSGDERSGRAPRAEPRGIVGRLLRRGDR
jgi:hypothetical protein